MKCGGCVRAVEQRLLDQPGVRQASVNLLTRTAWVDVVSPEANQGALLQSLEGLGFHARLRASDGELPTRRERLQTRTWWQNWRQLVVALALLLVSGWAISPWPGSGRSGSMPWWPLWPWPALVDRSWCGVCSRPWLACPAWTPWWASAC